MMRHLLLLLLGCVLLETGACADDHTTHCDDHKEKPAGVECVEDLPQDAACPAGQIAAKLYGCYFCVDAATCLLASALPAGPAKTESPIPTAHAVHKDVESGVAMVKANKHVQSPATGTTLVVVTDTQADSSGSWASRLSNWAFAAPVAALALVGVALAVRSRSTSKRGPEFERLQEDAADEINPFCANALAQDSDDGELEFVDEEQVANKEDGEEEDCDDEGPDIVVAHSILDDIDEEDEDDECL